MEDFYGKKIRKIRKKKFRNFSRIFFSSLKAEPEGDRREPKGECSLKALANDFSPLENSSQFCDFTFKKNRQEFIWIFKGRKSIGTGFKTKRRLVTTKVRILSEFLYLLNLRMPNQWTPWSCSAAQRINCNKHLCFPRLWISSGTFPTSILEKKWTDEKRRSGSPDPHSMPHFLQWVWFPQISPRPWYKLESWKWVESDWAPRGQNLRPHFRAGESYDLECFVHPAKRKSIGQVKY